MMLMTNTADIPQRMRFAAMRFFDADWGPTHLAAIFFAPTNAQALLEEPRTCSGTQPGRPRGGMHLAALPSNHGCPAHQGDSERVEPGNAPGFSTKANFKAHLSSIGPSGH